MPIQIDPKPSYTLRGTPAVVLAVLVALGIVLAVNWRAIFLALIVLAAFAGYMLTK